MRAAYIQAEALVKRCLNASHRAWNDLARRQLHARRHGSGFPGGPLRRMHSERGQMSLSDAPLGGARPLRVSGRGVPCAVSAPCSVLLPERMRADAAHKRATW